MTASKRRHPIVKLLESDGIMVDGSRLWDMQVHDGRLFPRLIEKGSIAIGQSCVDGWRDCAAVDQLVDRTLRKRLDKAALRAPSLMWLAMNSRLSNRQSRGRTDQVGRTQPPSRTAGAQARPG